MQVSDMTALASAMWIAAICVIGFGILVLAALLVVAAFALYGGWIDRRTVTSETFRSEDD